MIRLGIDIPSNDDRAQVEGLHLLVFTQSQQLVIVLICMVVTVGVNDVVRFEESENIGEKRRCGPLGGDIVALCVTDRGEELGERDANVGLAYGMSVTSTESVERAHHTLVWLQG